MILPLPIIIIIITIIVLYIFIVIKMMISSRKNASRTQKYLEEFAIINALSLSEARSECDRIIKVNRDYITASPVNENNFKNHSLPPTIVEIFSKYGDIALSSGTKFGPSYLEETDQLDIIKIGYDPQIGDYGVKMGNNDNTLYSISYDEPEDKYEPLYDSVYHWLIAIYNQDTSDD